MTSSLTRSLKVRMNRFTATLHAACTELESVHLSTSYNPTVCFHLQLVWRKNPTLLIYLHKHLIYACKKKCINNNLANLLYIEQRMLNPYTRYRGLSEENLGSALLGSATYSVQAWNSSINRFTLCVKAQFTFSHRAQCETPFRWAGRGVKLSSWRVTAL